MADEPASVLTASLRLSRRALQPGERYMAPVRTGSMHPVLVPGNDAAIEQTAWRACRPGDIVVFNAGGRLTAHRLLCAFAWGRRWFFLEKGDQNDVGSWIEAERVLGLVVGVRAADAAYADLRTAASRRRALRLARKHLCRDVWSRLLALPRRIKRWVEQRRGRVASG